MIRKISACMVISLFGLVFSLNARADDFHYINNLIGDRAAGMGGAYTAVSDDASGMFYNPAGIAYASTRNLSASVNAYYSLEKRYKGAVAGVDWKRESSSFLPNYFGIVHTFGNWKVGFSYAVPDASSEDQDQTFSNIPGFTSLTLNFNYTDNTYQVGPSAALEVAKDFAVGLTLYGHYRSADVISNTISVSAAENLISNNYTEVKETGIKPILGLTWSPVQKLALGFTISKVFLIDSDVDIQATCSSTDPNSTACPTGFLRGEFATDAKRNYPLNAAFGAAYFPSENLLISTDLTYHPQADDELLGNREAVLNVALGTEYYFTRHWAMRAGAFTDFANTPNIDPNKSGQDEHIDRYGGSLSMSYFTRNTSITLGGYMSLGSGEAQIIRNDTAIQDAEETAWTIYLSSSYVY